MSEFLGFTGISQLVTNDPQRDPSDPLGVIENGHVLIDRSDQTIRYAGEDPAEVTAHCRPVDLGGRVVLPAFVDAHTHLIFAGDRSAEFAARMAGERYDGGGIASTVAATRSASDDDLRALVAGRMAEAAAQGTGVLEIKSGYGLSVEEELRMVRLAAEFTDEVTLLGAHVVPTEFTARRDDYVEIVCRQMIPAAIQHARWVDVFCEPGSAHAFDGDEARAVLTAGRAAGLQLRVHAGQLGHGPGVGLGVELGAASVDHCTYLSDDDVEALAGSETVATLLPGVEFSTRSPYPDAAMLIDRGVQLALATDCNPGTCYSSSMPFMIALAVREMGMSVDQAIWSATAGAARSWRRDDVGRLTTGSRALLSVLEAPRRDHLAYRPGVPIARRLDLHSVDAS